MGRLEADRSLAPFLLATALFSSCDQPRQSLTAPPFEHGGGEGESRQKTIEVKETWVPRNPNFAELCKTCELASFAVEKLQIASAGREHAPVQRISKECMKLLKNAANVARASLLDPTLEIGHRPAIEELCRDLVAVAGAVENWELSQYLPAKVQLYRLGESLRIVRGYVAQ